MSEFRERLKPRFAAFGLLILVALAAPALRLWTMQILNGDRYAAKAKDNRVQEVFMDAPRGRILDAKGRPLVSNRPSLAVLVSPTIAHAARGKDKAAKAEADRLLNDLSALLGVSRAEIVERLSSVKEAPLEPRIVAVDVSDEPVAYLAEHEAQFPGVEVRVVGVRDYPQGGLAAHVLGYTGVISEDEISDLGEQGYQPGDIVGKSGAEKQFESVLQGDHGRRLIEVDARGKQRRIISESEPVSGRDVRLTIDLDVQRVAESALANAIEDAHDQGYPKAKAGAAIVLDVDTGEVIAMASAPTYDPRLFIGGVESGEWARLNAAGSEYPLNNRAIMSAYPPASTFKVVTGMAGLRYGITSEWRTFDCAGKWVGMGEQWKKYCWKKTGHGTTSFHNGIVYSCDTVFYEIGHAFYKDGGEKLQKVAREFNLGSRTGIDLPGEVPGRVPDATWKAEFNKDYPEYRAWLPGDTVNMAIGQGDMLATPLQMAVAYAAIANDGTVIRPHVLDAVLDADGKAVLESSVETASAVDAQPAQFAIMRRALEDVTERGTAKGAFAGLPRRVLGKTGTAEVYGKDDLAWFVALAPAEGPKYAVAVVVEQGGHGGSVAAPAAREVVAQLLGLPVTHVRAHDESR